MPRTSASSYSADLSYAVQGHQVLLSDFNTYSPSSYLGVVQHTGWGSTWAALQPVGSNYSTLNTTIGKLADCANNTTSAYNVYGGTATSIAVTTQTPACSGSDLATGIQQAINMFNSAAYTSTVPAGTAKAIIISSDGESNASSNGQHPSPTYTDAQLNTLAQTTAAAAWANRAFPSYVVFYYHGSDTAQIRPYCNLWSKGRGPSRSGNECSQRADSARYPLQGDMVVIRGGAVSRRGCPSVTQLGLHHCLAAASGRETPGNHAKRDAGDDRSRLVRRHGGRSRSTARDLGKTARFPPPEGRTLPLLPQKTPLLRQKQAAAAVPRPAVERLQPARRPPLRSGPRGCSRPVSAKDFGAVPFGTQLFSPL